MKRYINIVLALVVAVSAVSCKDFLTEEPKLAQSTEITLSSLDGCDAAVSGAYSYLASSSWYGGAMIFINEMMSGNGKRWVGTNHDSGRYTDPYAWNVTPTGSSMNSLWAYGYAMITACNNVLDKIDALEGDEATKDNLKAECLFLRALAHFDLVRTFGRPYNYGDGNGSSLGVPVVTVYQSPEAKPARNTVAEVYDQIFKDLEDAEDLMDPSYLRSGVTDSKAVASIYAVYALHSRASLYAEKWQDAADYATKVIESGKYAMWTADEAKNAACFNKDVPTGGEIIFEMYGIKSNSYDSYRDGLWSLTSPDGNYGDCGSSTQVSSLLASGDVRSTWFSADEDGEAWFTLKYAGKELSNPDVANTVIFRLSEMYLNRAEAAVQGATGSSAASDLQTVMTARGESGSATPTLSAVLAERQKELVWEGHYWFDCARNGLDLTRTDVIDGISTFLSKDDYRWVAPIPDREMKVNASLVQNEGYNE